MRIWRLTGEMTIYLCRPTLDLKSGAGQLMRLQAKGLEAAHERVALRCRHGALRFFLKTGIPARRASPGELESAAAFDPGSASRANLQFEAQATPRAESRAESQAERQAKSQAKLPVTLPLKCIVDHGMRLRSADVVFIHNLPAEGVRHLERDDWRAAAAEEAAFFRELDADAVIVANSELVRRALLEHFPLDASRVVVERPGFAAQRFNPERRERLCGPARRALGIGVDDEVVGFVTSGDFRKRGLDLFLEAAERVAAARADIRFLVVGSKRLPEWAARHALVRDGRLIHRPKSANPERWFAALDVFLYPARFEEFGLVVTEALALGIPVLTSRRVGAAECLPPAYAPWLLDAPDPAAMAGHALALLADADLRRRLGEAGAAGVAAFDDRRYVRATVDLILGRVRAKAAGSA